MVEDFRFLDGKITGDPTVNLPLGFNLKFASKLFPAPMITGSRVIKDWHIFDGAVVCLMIWGRDYFAIQGSGVMIAPGVAMVARHTYDELIENLKNGPEQSLVARVVSFTKDKALFWDVERTAIGDGLDIALLSVKPASDLPTDATYRIARVSTRQQAVGDRVVMVGFRPIKDPFENGTDDQNIQVYCRIGVGHITQIFPEGRPQSNRDMRNLSVFEVNCETIGSMSGGPVFDESGHLIGLLTYGMTGQQLSYVSPFTNAWGIELDTRWPNGLYRPGIPLIEILKICKNVERPQAVSFDDNSDGTKDILYYSWR